MRLKKLIFILLFLGQILYAQKIPTAYVFPFEARDMASEALANKAFAAFKSQLSASGRVRLFSAEAWRSIFSTYRLILTINDFRDSQKAIQVGKMTSVDYIALGQLSQQNDENMLNIDWINLHNGLIEKSFSLPIGEEDDLGHRLSQTVSGLVRLMVKEGRVIGQNKDGLVRLSLPPDSGWRLGDEFVLLNNLHYAYARVRLTSFGEHEALAELMHLNDRLRSDDRAVLAASYQPAHGYRPRAFLWPIEGPLQAETLQEMLYRARQHILDSGKFDLIENTDNGAYYSFRIRIKEKNASTLYLVNLSVKEYPGHKIIYGKNQDCLSSEVEQTVNVLLGLALSRWEKAAQVTRVTASNVMVNEGRNLHIREGQRVVFKEPGGEGIIAEGEISEVFPTYALAVVKNTSIAVRAGCLATFPAGSALENEWQQKLQRIYMHAQMEKQHLKTLREEKRAAEQEKAEQERLRKRPKSRLRIGYVYPLFKAPDNKEMFHSKKTSQMDVDIYLGSHPYLNIVLNYSYAHLNLSENRGFIFANAAGVGLRLHLPLFSPFSLYGQALYQYSEFQNRTLGAEEVFEQPKWHSSYLCLRAGLDISFGSGLSLYLEGGQRRKIKEQVINLEYYTAAAGLAFWF